MRYVIWWLLFSTALVLIQARILADEPAAPSVPAGMELPRYDDGALVRPEGWERWVFVGTSLGLSYNQDEDDSHDEAAEFHNVYIQPAALEAYAQSGTFPEKTMLVMTNYESEQEETIDRRGRFAGKLVGLEAAVKDSQQHEEGWAYYNFRNGGQLADRASALPKALCYDCHAQHGAADNVFVQFYPILRDLRPKPSSTTSGARE